MSSPWSVAKFVTGTEDAAQVWRLFWSGTIASLIFAVIVGMMMKDRKALIFSITGAGAVAAFMYWEYDSAIKGTL